jgi:DNA-binding NtrC family response regulator
VRAARAERHQLVASRDPGMKEATRVAKTAAKSNATVLLLGESGTGKELLARTIHQHSARRDGPFIAVNCVALAPTLLESELFGHEKGAFTGAATARKGKFELAEGGTLFLDEIGELSADFQTKLLRVLQEREFERVGGNETVMVDVRLIAATNKDLRAAIGRHEFREDLFYRLNVVSISIPPLRQRRDDIPALCTHFLMRACQATKHAPVTLDAAAIDLLQAYDWPGNVRELANAMERLVVLSERDRVEKDDLPVEIRGPGREPAAHGGGAARSPLAERVLDFKRDAVREALQATGGNQSRAAALLGLEQSNLCRMMKSLGLR